MPGRLGNDTCQAHTDQIDYGNRALTRVNTKVCLGPGHRDAMGGQPVPDLR